VRITYEFMRPVPLGELSMRAQVVRGGRRVMLLEASMLDAGGVEVARARALRVRPSELGEPPAADVPFPRPERGQITPFRDTGLPMFATDAMEIRFVRGSFLSTGSSIAWFRLRHPIIAGEPVSQLQRVAAASDFGNGIASVLTWDEHVFINPDLTLYVEREPVGVGGASRDAGLTRQRCRRRERPLGRAGTPRMCDPVAAGVAPVTASPTGAPTSSGRL